MRSAGSEQQPPDLKGEEARFRQPLVFSSIVVVLFIIPCLFLSPSEGWREGGGGYGVPPPRKPPGSVGGKRLFVSRLRYSRSPLGTIGGALNCPSVSAAGSPRTNPQDGIGICPMGLAKNFLLTAPVIPAISKLSLKRIQDMRVSVVMKNNWWWWQIPGEGFVRR